MKCNLFFVTMTFGLFMITSSTQATTLKMTSSIVNDDYTINTLQDTYDDLLDSFESYVNKYIDTMKKVKSGDQSAMMDLPDLTKKAQELSQKLQKSSGEMSPSQVARYQRISMKMLEAAKEMM